MVPGGVHTFDCSLDIVRGCCERSVQAFVHCSHGPARACTHTHAHTHDGHGKQAVDQDSLSVSPHNMSRHNSVA